jgi:NACHT N-terminal Helical domain 1/NACHT domain
MADTVPVGELVLVLSGVLVKAAFRLWIGDNALAGDLVADLTDMIKGRVGNVLEQRKIRNHFARTEEMIADQLLTTLEHEYRDLDESERNAAIIAVTMTFERAQLTDKQLFAADLDRLYLYQFVRRFAGNATSGLSEGGIALYERVLEQCCGYIIVIADKLPGFQVDAFAELLRRSRQILERQNEMLRLLPETSRDQQHASVDIAYRQLLVRVFDRLQLLGLDFTSQWYSLSIAYVSLTIAGTQKVSADRFEAWLAECPRLIISGRAGSGKTTVLQWLAVQAARRAFTQAAGPLNGRTPFFIRLREYVGADLPPPEQFLDKLAPMLAPKAGSWPREQMESGKALMLIDGVDELPEAQRPAAVTWLSQLIGLFPGVGYVVTTRPGALDATGRSRTTALAQLQELGFATAELEPMDPVLIRQFVTQWHAAVRAGLTDEAARQRLAAGEEKLIATIEHDRFLRDLADTPLLAGLICSLNHHLKGQLPKRRGEIFETALTMFRQRDLDRGIADPVQLDQAASNHLLGGLALWLVRNGAAEASEQAARQIIASSAVSLPSAPDDADGLYRHLVLRSGLLREPTAGHVDFVHRTFQEYLAAKSLAASNNIGELVRNAADDQWREVVILAAGQGNTQQTSDLLRGLLRPTWRGKHRYRRRLLAVACMEEVISADPKAIADVHDAVPELLPPRSTTQAEALSRIGERLLPLLEQHPPRTPDEKVAAIRAATLIGSREAMRVIAGLAKDASTQVHQELTRAWLYFDVLEFAEKVLAPADVESLSLDHMSLLPYLPKMPSIRMLTLNFDGLTQLPSLRPLDELPLLHQLTLNNIPETTQILTGVIGEWPSLESLDLFGGRMLDTSAIGSLPGLTSLGIWFDGIGDPSALTRLTRLRSITFWGEENLSIIGILPQLPALKEVRIFRAAVADLSPLAECELTILLYDTKPTGTDSPGFRPAVKQKPIATSPIKSAVDRMLRRS